MKRFFQLSLAAAIFTMTGVFPPIGVTQEVYIFPDEAGYLPLFNGYNLKGWEMQWEGIWRAENNQIIGRQDPDVGEDSWLFTESEWDDFSLELEFRMTENCNSGIGIRMPNGVEGRPSQHGFEIQISDVDEQFPTGSIFKHVSAGQNLHKTTDWHKLAIVAVGDHIMVYVNRQKVVDARVEGSMKGRIGLQVHGGEKFADQIVRFRNIKIKDLKPQYQAAVSPLQFKAHQINRSLNEGSEVVDINRDGLPDITSGDFWYEAPDWTPHQYRNVRLSGEFANKYGEIAMDINQDGWMDIISGGWFVPELIWYENPGDFSNDVMWKTHVVSDNFPGTETLLPCDIDRDGRTDLLMNRYYENVPVKYLRFVGTDISGTGFVEERIGLQGRGHGMGVGDVNADGRVDILTGHGWYESPLNPVEQPWVWHGNYEAPHAGIPMQVDDLNEDGLPDIIWGYGHDFGLYWFEQTRDSAGRQAWITHLIDDTYSQLHCVLSEDLDGDGTNDIITGKRYRGHNGTDPGANEPQCIFWYKVTKGPDPQFTKHIITYNETIGIGADLGVADYDLDGDKDIIAAGKSGLYILENVTGE